MVINEKLCLYTFHTGLPHNVSVFEAQDNVVGDGEAKFEAVLTSFLEGEENPFRIVTKWNWQNEIWSPRA